MSTRTSIGKSGSRSRSGGIYSNARWFENMYKLGIEALDKDVEMVFTNGSVTMIVWEVVRQNDYVQKKLAEQEAKVDEGVMRWTD